MNTEEWMSRVTEHRNVLTNLVAAYHPSSHQQNPVYRLPITAPNAESASNMIRDKIRSEVRQDPKTLFETALDQNDSSAAYNLLSSTWFGVPESTSCWSILGFDKAVELLEDPPDDLEGGGEEDPGYE